MDNGFLTEQLFDEISEDYLKARYTEEVIRKLLDDPFSAFPAEIHPDLGFLEDPGCKQVCVLGSGDNLAVFALALRGKQVTSVDISEKQLQGAKQEAARIGLLDSIHFVKDNIMNLEHIGGDRFDLVLTTNGTLNFISDLSRLNQNINRILKNKGVYFLFDTHPFMRPFAMDSKRLRVQKRYDQIGPFSQVYAFHYRIQDYINALVKACLTVEEVKEYLDETGFFWKTVEKNREHLDLWKNSPLASLPQWITVKVKKK